ncbi:hypothetical protein BDD12DRAFT_875879 [Trichophaea hybrida]|nr:hypothetical protein BDD12DRAFT_875879 [Trichophaea hybrida]
MYKRPREEGLPTESVEPLLNKKPFCPGDPYSDVLYDCYDPIIRLSEDLPSMRISSHLANGDLLRLPLFESSLNDHNYKLIRSFHRSLSPCKLVYFIDTENANQIWLVLLADCSMWPQDTHAGGVEIHVLPEFSMPPHYVGHKIVEDPVRRRINARRVLTLFDRMLIQSTFPGCGFLVVLFDNTHNLQKCWQTGTPATFGMLRVVFGIPTYEPTIVTAGYGHTMGNAPRSCNHCCLGLRLQLPTGETVISTVTHAYVRLRLPSQSKTILRLTDMYIKLKESLMQQRPVPLQVSAVGEFVGRPTRTNTSLGKTVVGTITITYDHSPSETLPFPHAFTHDLSLITSHDLPILAPPVGFWLITEWAFYTDVLDGAPLSMTRLNANTGVWRDMSGQQVSEREQ